jgi:large subunit ribosomal protein L18
VKLKFNKRSSARHISRIKNKVRIRRKVFGTGERPRLCVYKSLKHIYAQVIDDATGTTICSASSKDSGVENPSNNKEVAKVVGQAVARKALEKNISQVVFDRNGWVYHGRIQSLAEGAREGGLKF